MPVEHIQYTDVLRQGTDKINAAIDGVNSAVVKVDGYEDELNAGITQAKQIAVDAGQEAVQIATDATRAIEATANQANANSLTAINTANNAISTANQNKQEFDTLRNDFDDLVSQAGDSNPEIVQARTDTTGIKQVTLANRLSADFADRMTKADGIELFSGLTNVKKMMDFAGKTAGNTSTNPHQSYSDFTAKSLKKPSDIWDEISQSDYNKLATRDDSSVTTGSSANGVIPQQLYKLNAVKAIKTLAPQLFDGMQIEDMISYVKNHFVSLALTFRGKATSPNNKNLKVSMYIENTESWITQVQGDAPEYTDFTVQINDANFIGSDGFVHVIAYTDLTNGVSASSVDVDYIGVAIEISLNAQDVLSKDGFIKKDEADGSYAQKQATENHITNVNNPHQVTLAQVGGISPNEVDAKVSTVSESLSNAITDATADMLNEIIRRSPQIFEVTVADKTITNGSSEVTALTGLTNRVNTDPTRFLSDGNIIYISKAGTYTFDLSCEIVNSGSGTYFGFQLKQSNGDQSYPGPALKGWAGDRAPVIISGSTNFDAGDQLTVYTYPANAKYQINNLRIRLTYRGDGDL